MDVEYLPHEKGLHVSWDRLHYDARTLALRLSAFRTTNNITWNSILAVTRGGMVPAMIIARELGIRLVESISIMSYDYQRQAKPQILKFPAPEIVGDGTGVLVVDDLVDTGLTLEIIRKRYPSAYFVTLYAKPKGRPMVDTFIREVSQDTWIFLPWDLALQYVDPYHGKE